jgi:bifunctional non-homologous end joining protein LigD
MVKRAKAAMPGFIKPQLATLKMKAPSEGWIHEIKYDGYRAQVHLDKGTARILTRNGHDWTKRFSAIAGTFKLKSQTIFDGEVVVILDDGKASMRGR